MRKKINNSFVGLVIFSIVVTTIVLTFTFYTQLKKQVFSDLEVVVNLLIDEGAYQNKTNDLRIT